MNTGTQDPRHNPGRGLRKLTPGLLAAEALAEDLDRNVAVQSTRVEWRNAVSTLQRARELRPAAANLLMALIKFCGTWEKEKVAVVFASNERLADELGLRQTRSIRSLLRELSSGRRPLICHVERPGGRRGVEIDPMSGEKRYFGISLEPLIAQLPTIALIQEELDASFARRRILRSAIVSKLTRHKRIVSAAIDEGLTVDDWSGKQVLLDDISETLRNCAEVDQLEQIHREVEMISDATEKLFARTFETPPSPTEIPRDDDDQSQRRSNTDSRYGESSAPPITVNKSITDKSEQCAHSAKPNWTQRDLMENSPAATLRCQAESTDETRTRGIPKKHEKLRPPGSRLALIAVIESDLQTKKIGPDELCSISEELQAFLPYEAIDNPVWADVAHAADLARAHIGLSEIAWRHSIANLGAKGAIAAMAYSTACERVRTPAGYIRHLADLASHGRFVDLGDKVRRQLRLRSEKTLQLRPS